MKKIYSHIILLLVICYSIFFSGGAFAQDWHWAKTISCTPTRASETEIITSDKRSGSIYVAIAQWDDSLCLSPFIIHNMHDSQQAVIVKYDTAGTVMWARASWGDLAEVQKMTVDLFGNLYVFGCFSSQKISFGTDTIVNPAYIVGPPYGRNNCYFISKYDSYGNLKWIKSGINEDFYGAQSLWMGDIGSDDVGNVYISATFLDSVIHVGSFTLTNSHFDDTTTDILLAKYDSSGNVIWAKTFGGSRHDKTLGLAVGSNNRIYMTGYYTSPTLTFGTTTLTNSGSISDPYTEWKPDAFLTAFDTAGNVLWAKTSVGNAYSNTIALDNLNNIFICGPVYDTLFVSFGNDTIRNACLPISTYLAKFDTAGNNSWIKGCYPVRYSTGSWRFNELYGLTTDACNNVWSAGYMDPDTAGVIIDGGSIMHPPIGGTYDPMLFIGYSSSGALLQQTAIRTGGDDGPGLATDCNGNIYFAGDFNGKTVLGSDTLFFPGSGEIAFVAKYNPGLRCSGFCGEVSESIREQFQKSDIIIYPNPTTDLLTIKANDNITTIMISNLMGQTLYSQHYNLPHVQIDVADLPEGIYFIRINGTEVRKFVKM